MKVFTRDVGWTPSISKIRYLLGGIMIISLSLFQAPTVFANHGVGTSEGGATTTSAITLKEKEFTVEIRTEYTEFEDISNSRLFELGEKTGDFDVVDRTFFYSTEIAYGVTDDFTLGLSMGWFEPINFRVAESGHHGGEHEEDEIEKLHGDPEGITDLWLSGKYRVYRGPQGHVSILAGVKFPTGRDDAELENDEQIEAVEQAGSGSYDFAAGIAYSRWLTERLMMDSNVQYIYRTEGDRDFRIGDRFDANVALGYPLTSTEKYPNYSVTGELNLRHLLKDQVRGNREENSGGTTLFLSPGIRANITKRLSAFASVPVPVLQHVNGEQQRTSFKAIVGVGYAF